MSLADIRAQGLRNWYKRTTGLELSESVDSLRGQQEDAIEWALGQKAPYLLINAPTGTGKTLINLVYAAMMTDRWTYAVNTIRLQNQVADTLPDLPILTGRANHPCLISDELYGFDVSAAKGKCVWGEDCEVQHECPYYLQLWAATEGYQRVTNYSMFLALAPLRYGGLTQVLIGDEAHNVEEVVAASQEVRFDLWTLRRAGYGFPSKTPKDINGWRSWAFGARNALARRERSPEVFAVRDSVNKLLTLSTKCPHESLVVQFNGRTLTVRPLFGSPFVLPQLLGHHYPPEGSSLLDRTDVKYATPRKVLFTSATLLGADYIANMLGLPSDSWAYLDMPSVFPPTNRPIYFSPVQGMSKFNMADPDMRVVMSEAIDHLISNYVERSEPWGVVHAVSNSYRDLILTESRWRGIMTADTDEHSTRVGQGSPSVLVASNVTEGWDGYDSLCRFVIIPKVPFPDLGDEWTRQRQKLNSLTYDHTALVNVIQGAGRGVRHSHDYAETWILDANWDALYRRRKGWLPKSFTDAYHHGVPIP